MEVSLGGRQEDRRSKKRKDWSLLSCEPHAGRWASMSRRATFGQLDTLSLQHEEAQGSRLETTANAGRPARDQAVAARAVLSFQGQAERQLVLSRPNRACELP